MFYLSFTMFLDDAKCHKYKHKYLFYIFIIVTYLSQIKMK